MSTYFKQCRYNAETVQNMWMSVVGDFHDSICSCWHPFAHMLDLIFPEGHKDRDKTIREIIERDSQCHSGGDEEKDFGGEDPGTSAAVAVAGPPGANEEQTEDLDIEALVAAAEAAEKR